jgi:hypothetical protein
VVTSGVVTSDPGEQQQSSIAVMFPNGKAHLVPPGVSPADFARWNGFELAKKPDKPAGGLPHPSETNLSFADDGSDDDYDELIAVSGSSSAVPSLEVESAVPKLSVPSAIPTLGSASGFDRTLADEYVPLKQATKQYGSLIGRVTIHKATDGKRLVKKSDLAALGKNSRGSRAKQAAKPDGPAEKIAAEVSNATRQRQAAFSARQRKVDEHNQRRTREYEPRNY